MSDARDWYDAYGWHVTTEHQGDIVLQVVEYDWLDEEDDETIRREHLGDLPSEAALALIAKARVVRAAAEAVEPLLDKAEDEHGHGRYVEAAKLLDEASRVEGEHGHDPATCAWADEHGYAQRPTDGWWLACQCGEAMGERCEEMLDGEIVTVEWMPEHLRASHRAAGNAGTYPANGAVRLRVTPECAEFLTQELDGDGLPSGEPSRWAQIVEG